MNKLNQQQQHAMAQASFLNQLTPAQLLVLHQQFQQSQQQQASYDQQMAQIQQSLLAQQQQRLMAQQQSQIQQQQKISAPMSSPFSSSFSVNSLLSQQTQQQQPQANVNQLANAVITARHLAQAMASINMQKQLQQQQQQPQQIIEKRPGSESAFQVPAKKKQKLNERSSQSTAAEGSTEFTQNPLNSSICSISSPSSSSAYSSSSFSFNDYTNPSDSYSTTNPNHLDLLKSAVNNMEHNNNANNGSSASSSSVSFNDSNEFLDGHIDSGRSSPFSMLNDSKQQQGSTPSIRRSNRKRTAADFQNPCCPICGISLRLSDLAAHLNSELERLERVNRFDGTVASLIRNEPIASATTTNTTATTPIRKRTSSGSEKLKTDSPLANNSRQQAYLKIKDNRHTRIKNKLRLRMKEDQSDQSHLCPLCNESIGSDSSTDSHMQTCRMLRNEDGLEDTATNRDFNVNEENTSDSNQECETYEWAGQKRIRAISLLENPAQGIDATNVKKEEFDGELNVDFDDNIAFGKPQFNESDLILMKSDQGKRKNLLRQAVIDKERTDCELATKEMKGTSSEKCVGSLQKLDELENRETSTRCLICMEGYVNPLISVNCWHVHCKTCWMQSLGAKKLCPQCKEITTPGDLRRIFL